MNWARMTFREILSFWLLCVGPLFTVSPHFILTAYRYDTQTKHSIHPIYQMWPSRTRRSSKDMISRRALPESRARATMSSLWKLI